MKGLILAGAVVAALAFNATAQAAETVPLGYEQETGPFPYTSFAPESVERAVAFQVTYSADPVRTLEVGYSIRCSRGPEAVTDKGSAVVTPPFALTVPATMRDADECGLSAEASPPCCDNSPGTIRIDVTATARPKPPYWQRCPRPRWLKRGSLRVHGESLSCRAARRVSTRAWRRPERAGHYLRMGRYLCVRSGRGKRAVVQCSRGSERLKLVGRFRG